ncbi:MAG: STAS domain-containing protein [Myxococcales bacterium]|nr:STAS domain-containing protein [Myxococcales bacterium]MCB9749852.1 STAS domain-containing protein [Myxococcales bacterium]
MGDGASRTGEDELREALASAQRRLAEAERARVAAEERAVELRLDLARSRAQARDAASQAERLVEGLRRITEATHVGELYTGLLDLVNETLGSEDAFIVAIDRATAGATPELEVVATSASAYASLRWPTGRLFESVLGGKTRAAFDTSKLPEWRALPTSVLERARSALHLPIRPGRDGALLVCVHAERGYFTKPRVRLAARFSGLARNALRNAELLESRLRRLEELSTPMIPISAAVTVMPIIGGMDRERGERLLAAALRGAHERGVQRVIVDITALSELELEAARALVKTASALRLLGCRMTLSGVQPRVAATLVHLEGELGARLGGLEVFGTLQDAVARALI